MKNKILILMFIISSAFLFGQTSGDIMSFDAGTDGYYSTATWKYWDGDSWELLGSYPSDITTTVTINHDLTLYMPITISGSGKLVISPSGKLTNTYADNITNNGSFLIEASLSGSGQYLSFWDILGTKQTFLTGGNWHLVGSPVDNADAFTVFDGFYMQQYNQLDNEWIWNDSVGVFNPAMSLGHGYSAWRAENAAVTASGLLSATDVLVDNLGYNVLIGGETPSQKGYNLLSNPYTCGLLYTSDWVETNVNPFVWTWSQADGNYTSRAPGNSYIIAASEGFFMQANSSSASVSIAQGSRTTAANNNPPNKASSAEDIKSVQIKIQNVANTFADRIEFEFKENANLNYNGLTDASKMFSTLASPQLFMLTVDDAAVSIKGLDASQNSTLRLQLQPKADATYRITASEFTFDPTTEVLLDDLFTTDGPMTVDANLDYTFSSLATDDESRFVIYVKPAITGIDNPVAKTQFTVFGSKEQIRILSTESDYKVSVYNLLGQKLVEKNNLEGNASIDLSAFNQAIVLVSIQSEKELITRKIQLK